MAHSTFRPGPHAELLRKVFDLPARGLSKPLAESLLALDFPSAEAARIEELSEKANEGSLTREEEAELEAYVDIGDLLAYWQSRARQALSPPA